MIALHWGNNIVATHGKPPTRAGFAMRQYLTHIRYLIHAKQENEISGLKTV